MANQLTRRQIIQGAGAGLTLAGLGPLLQACGHAGGSPAPHSLAQLIIAQGSDATTMDVDFQSDTVTGSILYNMFDTLLLRSQESKPLPNLLSTSPAFRSPYQDDAPAPYFPARAA